MTFPRFAAFAFAFAFAAALCAQNPAADPAKTQNAPPAVEEKAPAAEEKAPAVDEKAPAVEEKAPAVEEKAPAVEEKAPAAGSSVLPAPAAAPEAELNREAKEQAAQEEEEAFPPDMKVDETAVPEDDITARYPDARGPEQVGEQETPRHRKPIYRLNRPIKYVLLVSNYKVPRMFAERARLETGTPYILLPANEAAPDENTILYFVPRLDEGICPIKAKDLSAFLAFLRPRNVVVLGDGSYVSALYRSAVPETCGLIEFSDPDWKINAIRLDNLLEMRDTLYNLHREYVKGSLAKPQARTSGIGY